MDTRTDVGTLELKEQPPALGNDAALTGTDASPSYLKFKSNLLSTTADRKYYVSVPAKFLITVFISVLWAALSVYLSRPWADELARNLGYPLALTVIACIAIIPGIMNAFLVVALML